MMTKQWVAPGHFYSPIPDLQEIGKRKSSIFSRARQDILGVDLREDAQLKLLKEEFAKYYAEQPWQGQPNARRYHFDNQTYSYADAIFLYCMLRHLNPARLIEVGSGYSSSVTLDTNELFLGNRMKCTFIEPYPTLLKKIMRKGDETNVRVFANRLQDVDIKLFSELKENDVLFIDSTHVSKVGSDVNRIFFEILPSLASGVYIHFHDIFYPFEYPEGWVFEGRQWHENYMLRAFLQYNKSFEVVIWNNFLEEFHQPFFAEKMPLCLKNTGASIWLHKI